MLSDAGFAEVSFDAYTSKYEADFKTPSSAPKFITSCRKFQRNKHHPQFLTSNLGNQTITNIIPNYTHIPSYVHLTEVVVIRIRIAAEKSVYSKGQFITRPSHIVILCDVIDRTRRTKFLGFSESEFSSSRT